MIMDNAVLFAWLVIVTIATLERGAVAGVRAIQGKAVGITTWIPRVEPVVAALGLTLLSVLYASLDPPQHPRLYFTMWIDGGYMAIMVVVALVEIRHLRTLARIEARLGHRLARYLRAKHKSARDDGREDP